MSDYPEDLRYSTDHEWVRLDGRRARIGITSYAQEALGDIVFVSLPAEGDVVSAGAECGEIESTKSVSPLLSPVAGVVVAVNAGLDSAPELVNTDPYGEGWMVEVDVEDEDPLGGLMTAEEYAAQLG
ncbi:MAG: glycine cleavage system protein GcvH [Kineosporiaceae bacterium]|nr:glycine cleavage system protein GcvH [Kineosporiaceae bacterium]